MVFGLVAAIVVCLGAIGMWLATQQKLIGVTESGAKASAEAKSEIQRLSADVTDAEKRAKEAVADLGDLKSEKRKLTSELETLNDRLATTETELGNSRVEVGRLSDKLEVTVGEKEKLTHKLDEYKIESSKIQEKEALEALSSGSPIRATTLWELELTRTARTWRTSVATNPAATRTPFDDSDDPLKTAVEIEAAALREDVGASVRVDWKSSKIDEPAKQHLVLRLAQEMMATAARQTEPTKLVVEGEDELSLRIDLDSEAGDSVITLSPPKITSDLVEISAEDGLIVTLKSADDLKMVGESPANDAV